jgi:hypothetical protein
MRDIGALHGTAWRGMGSEAVVVVDSIAGRRQAHQPHLAGTTTPSGCEIFLVLDWVSYLTWL